MRYFDLNFCYLNNTVYQTDDMASFQRTNGSTDKTVNEKGFVWFYYFSDDTVFKTDDW